ncbi:hypothetical protein M8J77_011230 [Diaphorina citri]|nr:hypothetical protein M8J77_011230 [Diaphorina citri]
MMCYVIFQYLYLRMQKYKQYLQVRNELRQLTRLSYFITVFKCLIGFIAHSLFEKFLAQCNRDYRENFKMFMASSKIVEITSQSFVETENKIEKALEKNKKFVWIIILLEILESSKDNFLNPQSPNFQMNLKCFQIK